MSDPASVKSPPAPTEARSSAVISTYISTKDMSNVLKKYAPKPFYGCTVSITIHAGENLIAMDQTFLNKSGQSDPCEPNPTLLLLSPRTSKS